MAALFLFGGSFAHAQHPHLPEGCEVETVEPYSRWKTHRGKPQEALAVVRYGDQSCNALVARCDGFLVVPESAWQAQLDKQRLEVIVTKAEGESSIGPFPITAALRRKTTRADYRLVKLNDHHLPSLPLLDSQQLTPGTPLLVFWATVDGSTKALRVESRRAHFSGFFEGRKEYRATLAYDEEAPRQLPSGAIVVDAASGAAVGMLPDGAQPTRLSTWRYWYDMVNQVGLAPDRDAAMGKAPPAAARMLPVKGGPVRLTEQKYLKVGKTSTFITDFGTDIVCCADFYCDINPVTNGEWATWRETLRDKPPLPATWSSVQNPPHHNPLIPIAGLRVQDMEDYAATQSKRMITEVEFSRAAYTKDMRWLEAIDRSVAEVTAQALPIFREYAQQINQRAAEVKLQAQLQKERPIGQLQINVTDITLQLQSGAAALWEQVLREGTVQANTQVVPGHVHSIQFLPEDKSDAGIRHIHLNVPEACQGWNLSAVVAPKTRGSNWDPFLSQILMQVIQRGDGAVTELSGPVISMSFDPIMKLILWISQFGANFDWGVNVRHAGAGSPGLSASLGTRLSGGAYFRGRASAQLGFRCVR